MAESWVDELVRVQGKGADLAPPVIAALRAGGIEPQSDRTYGIATTGNVVREGRERLGRVGAGRSFGLLRDAVSDHAKAHGFGA